jgi:hypothetical protein
LNYTPFDCTIFDIYYSCPAVAAAAAREMMPRDVTDLRGWIYGIDMRVEG